MHTVIYIFPANVCSHASYPITTLALNISRGIYEILYTMYIQCHVTMVMAGFMYLYICMHVYALVQIY